MALTASAGSTTIAEPKPVHGKRSVTILGSTGSIGCSTLDLISRDRERFDLVALTAHRNVQALVEQARQHRPRVAVIALANKECLVSAGPLFLAEVEKSGATLLPVDSEHNAIFQVLDRRRLDTVDKIVLTASGGPFRMWGEGEMEGATPAQAVAHPRWDMGAKISVDSATLMNKGLELIEAHYLFPVGEEKLDVIVHPESIVHSMVAYVDGSVLAQLGSPDMRTPISYTLAWPGRMTTPSERLNLAQISQLTFQEPDIKRFPALKVAREALRAGRSAPTVLNAANEVAVDAFLKGRIGFLDIVRLSEAVLDACAARNELPEDLHSIYEIDRNTRILAQEWVQKRVR